jgi:hypothetical protein
MPCRTSTHKRNHHTSRKINPRRSSHRPILLKRRTNRRGGSATAHVPTCGVATPSVVTQCMAPVDLSSYKNLCVSGVLPLDEAFLNAGVAVGGDRRRRCERRVRKTVNKMEMGGGGGKTEYRK